MCTIICRGTNDAELWPQQLGLPHPGHGPRPGWAGTGQGVPAHGMGWGSLPPDHSGFCDNELTDKSKLCWPGQWRKLQDRDLHCNARVVRGEQLLLLETAAGAGPAQHGPFKHGVQAGTQWTGPMGTAHTAQIRWFHTPSNRSSLKESLSCRTWWPKLHSPSAAPRVPPASAAPESRGAAELTAAPPNTPAELLHTSEKLQRSTYSRPSD